MDSAVTICTVFCMQLLLSAKMICEKKRLVSFGSCLRSTTPPVKDFSMY